MLAPPCAFACRRHLGLAVFCAALFPRAAPDGPLLSREWRLRDAGHLLPDASSTWDISEVEFYNSYATEPLRCVGLLKPASAAGSGVFTTDRNGPEEAIDGVVKWGNGWSSAEFNEPGGAGELRNLAWLHVSFVDKSSVQCVRLYQENKQSYMVSSIALDVQDSTGNWVEISSWNGLYDPGPPDWRWATLAVRFADNMALASSECPGHGSDSVATTMPFCCVWPELSNAPAGGQLAWLGGGVASCSDGATVRNGTQCQVNSTSCGSSGILTCVNGRTSLHMLQEKVDQVTDVIEEGCVQQQVDELTHELVESIEVGVTQYSPYCATFTISGHPIDMYNGEYVQQHGSVNRRPWFENSQNGRLYFYDGCAGGQPGWSLDDRPPPSSFWGPCDRRQHGGWRPEPSTGGLPSGTLPWLSGDVPDWATFQLDCQGSQYVPLGAGDCRDDAGMVANSHYQIAQHTFSTCRAQCDIDPQCVAYYYAPPAYNLGSSNGSCYAYIPWRESALAGWSFWPGDGATDVTAAVFGSDAERGSGWCFLKVDWLIGSDKPGVVAPPMLPSPDGADNAEGNGLVVLLVSFVAVLACLGFVVTLTIRKRAVKDPDRSSLAAAQEDNAEMAADAGSPNNSVVGKPSKPFVSNAYGGAIYGGAGGVFHASTPVKPAPAAEDVEQGAPPRQVQEPQEPEFLVHVEVDHSKASVAARAPRRLPPVASTSSALRDMGLLTTPGTSGGGPRPGSGSSLARGGGEAAAAAEAAAVAGAVPGGIEDVHGGVSASVRSIEDVPGWIEDVPGGVQELD